MTNTPYVLSNVPGQPSTWVSAAATPNAPILTGSLYYYWYPGTGGTAAQALNTMTALPFWLPAGCTIDRIGIEVTSGTALSVPRLGIYNDAGSGLPGTLLLDAGTIDGTSSGTKQITIAQAITASGYYWMAFVNQGAACTVRTVSTPVYPILATNATTAPSGVGTWFAPAVTGISGGLPSPFATGNNIPNAGRVFIRIT